MAMLIVIPITIQAIIIRDITIIKIIIMIQGIIITKDIITIIITIIVTEDIVIRYFKASPLGLAFVFLFFLI